MRQLTLLISIFVSTTSLALEIQGHRGSRWTHPENTLPGFREALNAKADVLEFDLGMTKDGVLVVSHDAVLNPQICRHKNGEPLKKRFVIYHNTLKELKKIDCGSMINPRFPQQKTIFHTEIPTFEEALIWVKEQSGQFALNVETKVSAEAEKPTASPQAFAKELARLIKKYNLVDRTVVQSFDFRSLGEIRKILPKVRTALLVWKQTWPEIKADAKKYKVNIISPSYKWLNKKIVRESHAMNLRVIPWTVNNESHWRAMIDLGVDGIITDRPRDLAEYLKR